MEQVEFQSCMEIIAADKLLGTIPEVELHVELDESWFGGGVHVDSECLERRGWNLKYQAITALCGIYCSRRTSWWDSCCCTA